MRTLVLPVVLALAATACSPSRSEDSGDTKEVTDPKPPDVVPDRPPVPDTSMRIATSDPDLAAPLSLTAADGTGLALTRLNAKVVVDGPISFTELHLSFRNPRPTVIEGRFAITLPERATISRLAMQIGDRWQEAEVVERQKARRAYEDFLHRRQDPALLEKEAGNEFRARIFPIPANGEKHLIVAYSQPLVGLDARYRLPLRGLPRVAELKIHALVGSGTGKAGTGPLMSYQTTTVEERDYVPNKDFEVAVPAAITGVRSQGLDGGDVVAMRVRPRLEVVDEALAGLVILFDTSASRALGYSRQVDRLGALVRELAVRHGANPKLVVAAFDQSVTQVYEGTFGGFGAPALDSLRERRALGASNLHAALSWAGDRKGLRRVLVITDGIATAGPSDGAALRALATSLKGEIERLDVVLTGGIRDAETAARLVRGTLARDGVALDGDQPVEVLARRISQTTVSGIAVRVASSRWVWPSTLDGVQPGDEYLVFARMNPGALANVTTLGVGLSGSLQQSLDVPLTPVAQPLLVRATVHAEIARLAAMRDEIPATQADARTRRDHIKQEIIALSTRYRVLSDYTALLVLETEADYARYGIERQALADILTVGPRGVELVHREQPVIRVAKTPPPPPPRPRAQIARRKGRSTGSARSDDKMSKADEAPEDTGAPTTAAAKPAPEKPDMKMEADQAESRSEPSLADRIPQASRDNAFASLTGTGQFQAGLEGREAGNARGDLDPPSAEPVPVATPAPAAVGAGGNARPESGRNARIRVSEEDIPARRRPAPGPADNRPPAQPNSGFQDSAGFLAAPPPKPRGPAPLTGKLAEIMRAIEAGQTAAALQQARAWRSEQPGDLMALLALGESLEASGDMAEAARAYGSIIDLFPSRADMRRFAGERLDRLTEHGAALAADSYAKAVAQRPDHLTGHRLLAMALLRQGRFAEAFAAAETGLRGVYPPGRFLGGQRILRDDLGLIAAAWLRAMPKQRSTIMAAVRKAGAQIDRKPSLRFVLTWETDANDVDFHIHDGKGGHAYYAQPRLPSGGELFADVTTGYGPECFTIPGKPAAFPYTLRLHYYSRGPMGFGMGKLEVMEHDGKGRLSFEQRPFVVMNDGAYVEVGQILPSK